MPKYNQVVTAMLLPLVASILMADGIHAGSTEQKTASVKALVESPPDNLDDLSADQHKRCSIFLAPSSLIGSSGFGVYTTRTINQGDFILNGPDGPNIPVVDYDFHPFNKDPLEEEREAWIHLFDSYWWGRGVADQMAYESENTLDYQITFGSLPNHHCVLDSLEQMWPKRSYDDTMADPRKDPGAGAFSYHTGRDFFAGQELDAGDEIFLNYGHCDSDNDDHDTPTWVEDIPKTDDYLTAAMITIQIWKELEGGTKRLGSETVVTTEVSDTMFDAIYGRAIRYYKGEINGLVLSVVPTSKEQVQEVMSTRKGDTPMDVARRLARILGTNRRSVHWITEHGLCIENLLPRRSGIAQAGRGGFAQWPLEKGEIVVPVPLLQILDRDVLTMYNNEGEETGAQLLMNYCLGHKETSMLLCPYTNAILVNHCSSRQNECGPKGPNAEIRWASGWEEEQDNWLGMSIDEIAQQSGRGLAMEIVATRDIEAGEEIFIDYGKGWEDAWTAHVARWNERPSEQRADDDFISVTELNERTGAIPRAFISGDLRKRASSSTVFTGCAYQPSEEDEVDEYGTENPSWQEKSDEDILLTYADNGAQFKANYSTHEDSTYWPCYVLVQEDEEGTTYTVRMDQAPHATQMPWDENDVPRILTSFPRSSIHFFKVPNTGDQHMAHTFRHYMEIPDGLVPEKWKNRRSAPESTLSKNL